MRVYIATRLENYAMHNAVRDALIAQGHEITYDWTVHGPVWRDGTERIAEVQGLERDGVAHAHVVVVLLPGGRGTHVELGMALALGKSIVLWSPSADVFTAHPDSCAFYHDPSTVRVTDANPVKGVSRAFHQLERCLRLANDLSGERCSVERRHHGPETWIGQRHDFDGPSERKSRYGA